MHFHAAKLLKLAPAFLCLVPAHQVAKFEDHWIAYCVHHRGPGPSASDQTRFVEQGKVLGDVRLVAIQGGNQFIDRLLPRLQLLQKTQTERFSKHPKSFRNQLDHLVAHVLSCHIFDNITEWRYGNTGGVVMAGTFIDVREYPEYAAGHIKEAKLVPLGNLAETSETWPKGEPLTLICKSGRRAEEARKQLAANGFTKLTVLPGGMDAWCEAGERIEVQEHRPWAIERQVRTAAGSLIVATLALGVWESRYFLIGTALVGAGLVYAGASDTCMMAAALARMRWNRPAKERA